MKSSVKFVVIKFNKSNKNNKNKNCSASSISTMFHFQIHNGRRGPLGPHVLYLAASDRKFVADIASTSPTATDPSTDTSLVSGPPFIRTIVIRDIVQVRLLEFSSK
jgi:hypothetical protein